MRFCTICENRLEDITTSNKLYYECTKCKKTFDATDEDTLIFTQSFNKKESTMQYETMLKTAAYDNANPKVYKDCTKCDNKIVSYVVLGHNMKYVYLCECGNMF